MNLKTLKLELLERIALIDSEERLLALKRLLDSPRNYGVPNEKMSVVKEGASVWDELEDRPFTREEVQRILQADRVQQRALQQDHGSLDISKEELALLDARRERHLKGESRSYTWNELEELMKNDLKR